MRNIDKKFLHIAKEIGFHQQGDIEVAKFIGAIAKLQSPKKILELGTGIGLTTFHLLQNMPDDAKIDTVENNPALIKQAKLLLGKDPRIKFHNMDGQTFLSEQLTQDDYDFIFADTWPGKYFALDAALRLVSPGGLYIIDDMNPCDTWPEGHDSKAASLIEYLTNHPDFTFSWFTLGTGIGIAQKRLPKFWNI